MIELSGSQRKTVASAVTLLSTAVVVAFVSLVVWGLFRALAFTASAIVPVLVGFFLSLFFKPYYRWWRRVTGGRRAIALPAMLLTILVPLGFLLWHAGALLVDQASNLIAQGPDLMRQVVGWFRETFPRLHTLLAQVGFPADGIGEAYERYGATALKAGSGAFRCLKGLLSVVVTFVFFIFFLTTRERRGGELVERLPFLSREMRTFLAAQVDGFVDILVSFFQRQAVICLVEGVLYGAGFLLVGLPYGFLVGFTLGVLNLIPLFGSVVCLPVALALAYFPHDGSVARLLLVLSVWLCGQAADGYVITPRIQGGRTGLGYAGVIFSFFFWSKVLGVVLGMLLAIPLSAFCVVLWRALCVRYFRSADEGGGS